MEAAQRIALVHGSSKVTFKALMEEAGISKSGILYHFKSKEQILEAMVDDMLAHADSILALGSDPNDVDLRTRAYAQCDFDPSYQTVPIAWVLALTQMPELFEPVNIQIRRIDATEDCFGPEAWTDIMLTRLALDGLAWSDIFDLERYSRAEREEMFRRLVGVVEADITSSHPED